MTDEMKNKILAFLKQGGQFSIREIVNAMRGYPADADLIRIAISGEDPRATYPDPYPDLSWDDLDRMVASRLRDLVDEGSVEVGEDVTAGYKLRSAHIAAKSYRQRKVYEEGDCRCMNLSAGPLRKRS